MNDDEGETKRFEVVVLRLSPDDEAAREQMQQELSDMFDSMRYAAHQAAQGMYRLGDYIHGVRLRPRGASPYAGCRRGCTPNECTCVVETTE